MYHDLFINKILSIPVTDIAKLPLEQLYDYTEQAGDLADRLKQSSAIIQEALIQRFEQDIEAKRQRWGRKSGRIHLERDGFKVTAERKKKILWDEELLESISLKIRAKGENPHKYMDISYRVNSNLFNSWSEELKKVFEPARSEEVGKEKITLAPLERDEDDNFPF